MSKTSRIVSIIFLVTLVLSACNLPGSSTQEPEQQSAEVVLTAAAQTVEANLTKFAEQAHDHASCSTGWR